MMDTTWLDRGLSFLSPYFHQLMDSWSLFEPVPGFYAMLESGEEDELEQVTARLATHLGLSSCPAVSYEWGLRLDPIVAGQINLRGGQRSHIQIPLFYVGKPDAIGAILAHELTHAALDEAKVPFNSLDDLERHTDLAAFFLGLGKLILNCTILELGRHTGDFRILGYLEPEIKAYAFNQVNALHHVPSRAAQANLNPYALSILAQAGSPSRLKSG